MTEPFARPLTTPSRVAREVGIVHLANGLMGFST